MPYYCLWYVYSSRWPYPLQKSSFCQSLDNPISFLTTRFSVWNLRSFIQPAIRRKAMILTAAIQSIIHTTNSWLIAPKWTETKWSIQCTHCITSATYCAAVSLVCFGKIFWWHCVLDLKLFRVSGSLREKSSQLKASQQSSLSRLPRCEGCLKIRQY